MAERTTVNGAECIRDQEGNEYYVTDEGGLYIDGEVTDEALSGEDLAWLLRHRYVPAVPPRQQDGDGEYPCLADMPFERDDAVAGFDVCRLPRGHAGQHRAALLPRSVPEAPEPAKAHSSAAALIHEHAADIQEFATHRSAELCAYLLRLFEQEEAEPAKADDGFDRLTTILDEAFGLQPVAASMDELLTVLERELHKPEPAKANGWVLTSERLPPSSTMVEFGVRLPGTGGVFVGFRAADCGKGHEWQDIIDTGMVGDCATYSDEQVYCWRGLLPAPPDPEAAK
jgi:hypothetical protein